MLTILQESGGTFISLKASGVLTIADQEALFPPLEESVSSEAGHFAVLVDMADLREIQQGARSEALWFDMRYWPRVERIAVVCGDAWNDEVERAADIYKAAQVKRFAPDQIDTARAWLKAH